MFNLVEGVIRIVIFILYLRGHQLIPDLRRVFEYHGAEHKVIHAYEACGRPDAEYAQKFSTLHPRCGTASCCSCSCWPCSCSPWWASPSVP